MDREKVIIVHLNKDAKITESKLNSIIDEIKELVRASGADVERVVIQNSDTINSKFYIGSGKVEELRDIAETIEADTIIFNNELTGSQMRNLEEIIDKKIVDRTGLILDIFATRAKTKEAKLQVKLAQLEYRLPRLVGFRNYLSRTGGGIGTRGPGEQKLETDRRTVEREIDIIKNKLKDTKKVRDVKRAKRVKSGIPIVSLIGYSNAGKSTLLNKLGEIFSKENKDVYSDDLLFATLDTSARYMKLQNNKEIIVSDTVGFVSNLPTKLVESFKSTLEEIEDSNLLLIVVDTSNEDYELQIESTRSVLKDMDIRDKKILYVFNKIDKNPDFRYFSNAENEIYISALNFEDVNKLAEKLQSLLFEDFKIYKAVVPYSHYERFYEYIVQDMKDSEEFGEMGITTHLYLNKSQKEKLSEVVKYV